MNLYYQSYIQDILAKYFKLLNGFLQLSQPITFWSKSDSRWPPHLINHKKCLYLNQFYRYVDKFGVAVANTNLVTNLI